MARRASKEGSIYRTDAGDWRACITLGYAGGKRRRKYLRGRTQGEVREKLRQALAAQAAGLPVADGRLRLDAYLERWLEETVRPTRRPRTYESYEGMVRLHLNPALGRHLLAELTPEAVNAHLVHVVAGGGSARLAGLQHAVLRSALTQAVRWGLVARNVASLVRPPADRRKEIEPLDVAGARALLEVVRTDRLYGIYAVGLALGLRQGEILALRWADVDFEAQTLRVGATLIRVPPRLRQPGAPWWAFTEPKTGRSRRTLHMPRIVSTALRQHRTRQLEERVAAGEVWQDLDLVFCDRHGGPLFARTVDDQFKRHLREAGLPAHRFHDLRHSCATFLLAQGVPARVVMETLGHTQIGTTMNIYAHLFPEARREAADLMDVALSPDAIKVAAKPHNMAARLAAKRAAAGDTKRT